MMRRVALIALAAAAVFAAILGAVSTAQDPAATSSPEGTPAAIAPAPVESAAPEVTTAPIETPAETPTEAPTETATQAPTADAPAPAASPEQMATASPAPEATSTATSGSAPEPASRPSKGVTRKQSKGKTNTESSDVKIRKCSASTSGRDCQAERRDRDDRNKTDAPAVTIEAPQLTTPTGAPAPTNPGFSLATVGPAPIGVPNFFIDKFRIPPFLLSIYQAAGMQYGVRWEVLDRKSVV